MASLSFSILSLSIWLITLAPSIAVAQSQSDTSNLSGDDVLPTGSDVTYSSAKSTITLPLSAIMSVANMTKDSTGSGITYLLGGTAKQNISKTSTAKPTNTQQCNNFHEFCTRKYSNITMVTTHNFAFVRKGNLASNQALGVIDQLNDGIRMREY